jgi:hypothetical protein
MPQNIDILLERLRHYDEVSLLELLDIDAEDILHRFRDVVIKKREYLCAELEILPGEELDFESEEWNEELDGFQIEYTDDE